VHLPAAELRLQIEHLAESMKAGETQIPKID
jgi:hypothetical protein